jgi:CRISPR/Cas system CSM-associated protein Csm3 (group 7 of RAMP superfamily)
MHKKFVNHCTINLSILPQGPILIKSGKEGADPTKPDMEFVETYHQGGLSIYLPGSSLKGAIRAHAERIVRTVGTDKRPENSSQLWANDPLKDDSDYFKKLTPAEVYQYSSFTEQLFGNTSLASRLRIEDAYPETDNLKIEERNGVAIDRVFGSVAVGPFNYQVCTEGEFKTKIHLKNFTLAQLGLIGLVLRDLNEGWFGLGFAKSRGMGTVKIQLNSATVQYPGCILENEQIRLLGSDKIWLSNELLGVGAFLGKNAYEFPGDDQKSTFLTATAMELGLGVELSAEGEAQVKDLFSLCVQAWRKKVEEVT